MTRSALKNVQDEDDMEEETDGLDPRMLRPRGYSPRRSASGSGRVEMYFPEVDVDVRQHGSSRPREPSIPLSHIRSSEDVSSGYSSAEPLYAGHHATKSEGLATSREPLVRTASVGSTRSMRTKSSRGGVVAKRGPAAEDSDFFELQEEESHCNGKEDLSYPLSHSPVSKSVAENRPTTPINSIPATIPEENNHITSKLNNVATTQEQFLDASDQKAEIAEDGEEDLPFNDAETDETKTLSNDFSLSESLVTSERHDVSSLSNIETPSSKDLTISSSVTTKNDTIPHPFTLSSEEISISELSMCDSQKENDTMVPSSIPSVNESKSENTIKEPNLNRSTDVANVDKTVVPLPSSEAVIVNNDIISKEEVKLNQVQALESPTELKSSAIDVSAQPAHTASESKEPCEDASTIVPSLAEESVSETQPALATSPLTVSSSEPLSYDNTDISESVTKCDTPISILSSNKTENETSKDNSMDNENPYESVESLALPDQPSRSNSQTSLRKEGRGGRYHKPPAPTPPPKTPDIPDLENENLNKENELTEEQKTSEEDTVRKSVSPTLERKDLSEDTTTGSDDSEAAVTTARLILKPGVVRSVGPDANTKAEVFVSKTPQAKSKKSKSKHKGESGLSKFFAIPRNQFGSLTSLIPFWHGKQEPPSPGASSSASGESAQSSSMDNVKEMSHSPGQKRRAPLAHYDS
ncbi:hypothetical protein C0J52_21954 [Blattella germanica]|nr:hypothetical protein C0J52_21954 [Blattella germanica]